MAISLNLAPLVTWGFPIKEPFVIAGPCSAESREQLLATAEGLAGLPISLLRAGIWKPRTRPNSFEGVGAPGLAWLKEAGEVAGVPVTTEVASPQHVEEALNAGIDVLWVGARTTVNPFSVQAIADALKGVDIPVLVKNPINPDIELWIGALERLNQAGLTKLGAIHRGFSSYDQSKYRNRPTWRIPIELRRRIPHLPIICDPSHISGNRVLLFGVAQKALDLTFDGLMIESHVNPDAALSDAKQQVTPAELGRLMAKLEVKRLSSDDDAYKARIDDLRRQIDALDVQAIELLAQRMNIAKEIGFYKKINNIAIFQPERWKETISSRVESGKSKGLSEEFVMRVYQLIHEESIRHQEAGGVE